MGNPSLILMPARLSFCLRPLGVILFGVLSGLAPAQVRITTSLSLSEEPAANVLNVTLSAFGIEDEESSDLSGAVEATLEINPGADQVSRLTINSANLTATDMSFSLAIGEISVAEVSLNGIEATIATSQVGWVDPATGQFDAGEHEVTLSEGVISGTSVVGEVNENFSESPVSGAGSGTGEVALSRMAIKGNTITYSVVVVLPVEFSNPLQEGVDVRVDSTVQFEGVIEVPLDPFAAWAELQGIPDAPFGGDHDGDGVPNGLLWALGYDADARPTLFAADPLIPGQVDIIVEHGPAGIRAPILVEGNFNQEGWTALDPFLLLGFENPVPVGEILPTVVLLSGDQNVVRLRVEKP
ncbi:MAG: hypothetical protein CBB78_005455 [Roseibacillus sp. TMED18]|nr:MAG: hypothetical protein CBB78_005455 [Roseibacillus sp. TMED18]